MATARLKRIRKRKEEDRIYWNSAIRRCCLRGSLIGSTIPISQLDLFALTAEDVSYGKKRVKGRKNTENKTEQGDGRVFQKYMKRDENSCKHMAGERDKQERTWIKTKAACVYTRRHFQSQKDNLRMAANQEGKQHFLYREGFDGSQSIALTTATVASHPSAWK